MGTKGLNKQSLVDAMQFFKKRPVIVILIIGLLLKIFYSMTFPWSITEDSDAYLIAAQYFDSPNEESIEYLNYRQLAYPWILWVFGKVTNLPLYSVIIFQILVSSLTVYLIYSILDKLKVHRYISIGVLVYYTFKLRPVTYALAIAPETLLVFLVVLSQFLIVLLASYLSSHKKKSFSLFAIYFGIIFSILGSITIKESMLPHYILTYVILFLITAYNIIKNRFYFLSIPFSLATVTLIVLTVAHGRYYGKIIDSPFKSVVAKSCWAWAFPYSRFYLDMDSNLNREYKNELREFVNRERKKATFWRYNYDLGLTKYNEAWWNKGDFLSISYRYAQKKYGEGRIRKGCSLEKFTAENFLEGFPKNLVFYLKRQFIPEVLRFFFSNSHNEFGKFKAFSERSFREFKGRFKYVDEFHQSKGAFKYYTLISNGFFKFLNLKFANWFLFKSHLLFSLLFMLLLPIFFLNSVKILQRVPFDELSVALMFKAYFLGNLLVFVTVIFVYERYVLYILHAMIISVCYMFDLFFIKRKINSRFLNLVIKDPVNKHVISRLRKAIHTK